MTADAAGFQVATGAESLPVGSAQERAAAVQAALEGLKQIRRVMHTHLPDPLAVPAEWERHQPVRAVAVILEAAGIPPSAVNADGQRIATGYCVSPTERPQVVRVEWRGPPGSGAVYQQQDELRRCAAALRRLGWLALEYRGPRRHRYLEVEPFSS